MIKTFSADFWEDVKSFAREVLSLLPFSTHTFLLIFIIFAAIIARIPKIGLSITHDEAYTYLAFIRGSLFQTVSDYHLPNNHVFSSVLLNLVYHLGGKEIWVLRIMPLTVGVLMVPASYILGKRLYNPATGTLAALMVAFFPTLLQFSFLIRGYILVAFFTLLAFILGNELRRKKNRFSWLLLVIIFSLGFFTIPTMFFPFLILYFWLLFSAYIGDFGGSYTSKWDFLRYWLISGFSTAFLTTILYLPILLFSRDEFFANNSVIPVPWEILPDRMWGKFLNTWEVWTRAIPSWMIWAVVFGSIFAFFFHKKLANHRIPMQLAFIVGITTVILLKRPNSWPRIWSFSIAPLLIFASAGIVGAFRKLKIKKTPFEWVFIGLMSFLAFIYTAQLIPNLPGYFAGKSNTQAIADFLDEELRTDDLILINTTSAPILEYEMLIRNETENYFDRKKTYGRIFLVVQEWNGENLDTMLEKFAEPYRFDLDTLQGLRSYGNYHLYEVFPLQ